jgi:hypothetical protein
MRLLTWTLKQPVYLTRIFEQYIYSIGKSNINLTPLKTKYRRKERHTASYEDLPWGNIFKLRGTRRYEFIPIKEVKWP